MQINYSHGEESKAYILITKNCCNSKKWGKNGHPETGTIIIMFFACIYYLLIYILYKTHTVTLVRVFVPVPECRYYWEKWGHLQAVSLSQ